MGGGPSCEQTQRADHILKCDAGDIFELGKSLVDVGRGGGEAVGQIVGGEGLRNLVEFAGEAPRLGSIAGGSAYRLVVETGLRCDPLGEQCILDVLRCSESADGQEQCSGSLRPRRETDLHRGRCARPAVDDSGLEQRVLPQRRDVVCEVTRQVEASRARSPHRRADDTTVDEVRETCRDRPCSRRGDGVGIHIGPVEAGARYGFGDFHRCTRWTHRDDDIGTGNQVLE